MTAKVGSAELMILPTTSLIKRSINWNFVNSGPEAIQKALELKPQLIILDNRMPNDRDGVIAALEIKEQLPQSIFILWSSDESKYWPHDFPGEIYDKRDSAGLKAAIKKAVL